MDAPPPSSAAPASTFDLGLAATYAIGVGVPLAAGIAWWGPIFGLFAGVGATNALFADPRRRAVTRIAAIAVAMAALLAVAGIATQLRDDHATSAGLTIALAFVAGFVPVSFPYLSIVARLLAFTMIAVATTVMPPGHVLGGYLAGVSFATVVALAASALRGIEPYANPWRELVLMWRGDRNDLAYAIAFASAVALALAGAYATGTPRSFWAVLAALFVMHPDREQVVPRIGKRIAGTFAGVGVAWLVVSSDPGIVVVAVLTVVVAAAIPAATKRGLFAAALVDTLFVLLLLDVGLYAQGGDRPLIVTRLVDTLIGTAAVAIATFGLDRWRRRPGSAATAPDPAPRE